MYSMLLAISNVDLYILFTKIGIKN